jgi:hypothetical protein
MAWRQDRPKRTTNQFWSSKDLRVIDSLRRTVAPKGGSERRTLGKDQGMGNALNFEHNYYII